MNLNGMERKHPGAYAAALRGGYLQQVTTHMPVLNAKGNGRLKKMY